MYEVLSLASVKLLVELIIRCCFIIFALALVSEKEVFLSVLNCGFCGKDLHLAKILCSVLCSYLMRGWDLLHRLLDLMYFANL